MLEVIVSMIDKKNRECTYQKHNSHRVSIYNEKIYAPSGLRGQNFFHETDRLFGKKLL